MNLLIDDCKAFYDSLAHGDSYSDLRCIDVEQGKYVNRKIVKGWNAALEWLREYNGRGNCFIGRNPRNLDGTVSCVVNYSFDLDFGQPGEKRKGSTIEQVEECLAAAKALSVRMPQLNLGFSGNGILAWYGRANLQADVDFKLVEESVRTEVNQITGGRVYVDKTSDAARMVKFLGTVSCKGERRMSRILNLSHRPSLRLGNYGNPEQLGLGQQSRPDSINRPVNPSSEPKIPHGRMHNALVEFAGACRRRGLSEGGIYRALVEFAKERCQPPVDLNRLKQYARSMMNYEPETQQEDGDNQVEAHTFRSSLESYSEKLSGRSGIPELRTGFDLLDRFTGGLLRTHIYTVGAYTGEGKTTWCANVAYTLLEQNKRVLYLSTELSYDRLFDKIIGLALHIPAENFNRGLSEEEKNKIKDNQQKLAGYQITINDTVNPRIEQVKGLVESTGPDVLIFDHIQQIGEGSQRRNEAIAQFLNGLHELARKHNFALLVVSQFKRPQSYLDFTSKSVVSIKIPTVYDFKECAAIENKSRVALLIYEKGEAVGLDKPVMVFEVAKNNFGKRGKIEMIFDKSEGRFYEREEQVNAIHSQSV